MTLPHYRQRDQPEDGAGRQRQSEPHRERQPEQRGRQGHRGMRRARRVGMPVMGVGMMGMAMPLRDRITLRTTDGMIPAIIMARMASAGGYRRDLLGHGEMLYYNITDIQPKTAASTR